MYEIRCIVGDKKLREVLVFLTNNSLEPPVVIPTGDIDASSVAADHVAQQFTPKKPSKLQKKKSVIPHGGRNRKGKGCIEVVRDFIQRTRATTIAAREMAKVTMAAGYSKNAYSHALKLLLADNTVFPLHGQPGVYGVTNPTTTVVT